ncbi:hypothetical protein MKZ08_13335 [Viridibacillus sp. FSL R5-0477]|uniref:Uncharacterized protein n=1 Tax=Viridibacillus arenosi FSL R5-213 TaxID=1227360 RepID=W4EUU5_9BACL|nr:MULTISPECIES: hypothetical protein [Viridibacillus]ETT84303.1 hypothetical protein C176_11878 [Viridibacillus arenosi FSL R5-213]OMC77227.1 hypothetical protein BK130_21750 [Viridibacillus sp. FSL H8-0123]OMC86718.1 hypothetical protein BK137_21410 [Viridibacillus arenosi]
MKNDKKVLYFYMILVSIGTILIALGIIGYLVKLNEPKGYLMIFFGFLLTINYINYIEKKLE